MAIAVAAAGSRTRLATITGRPKAADSEVAVVPSQRIEQGAGRQLDEAVGQPGAGVVAVACHDGHAGPVEQGTQR